jgi:hypothetical protein
VLTFTLLQLPIEMLLGVLLARICRIAFPLPKAGIKARHPHFATMALGLLLYIPWSTLALDSVSSALVYRQRWIPFVDDIRKDSSGFHTTLDWLVTLRPGRAVNHFALATVYRSIKDRQTDPDAIRSLAITSALEYRKGLDVNPWDYMIYVYYADLLVEHPEINDSTDLNDDPIRLLQTAVARAPIYLEPYIALAERYEERGEAELAFLLLKEKALPWVDLKYWDYERSQIRFMRKLLVLSGQFADTELTEYLQNRLAELPSE